MGKLVSTAEYAAAHGKSARVIRQKIATGTLKAALIGASYVIDADEPYIDARIKTGKYIRARYGYEYQKQRKTIRAAVQKAAIIAAESEK